MQYKLKIFLSFIIIQFSYGEVIGEGLYGNQLFNYLNNNYQASNTLGYNNARDIMYSLIDIKDGNQLTGVYSGFPEAKPLHDVIAAIVLSFVPKIKIPWGS